MRIRLDAKTTQQAKREISERFPQGATYIGYNAKNEPVIKSVVLPRGAKPVFGVEYTVRKHRHAVWFDCEPF